MGLRTWLGLKKHQSPDVNRMPAQHPDELPSLMSAASRASSYLEIGTRFGGTFNAMVRMMPPGSTAVAVDLPNANWGLDSEQELRRVTDVLREDGYNVHLFLGNSQNEEIIGSVRELGPFDVALIDGDHLYDGVKMDWQNYGPMSHTVIFHDVAGESARKKKLQVEVPRLWREIKSEGYDTCEVIGRNSNMGLGLVYRSPSTSG